jgi:hypothetical protein
VLTGGAGADRFREEADGIERAGYAGVAFDFSRAEGDRIDLSALGATALLGARGFTGRAGEVNHTYLGLGGPDPANLIRADLDCDQAATSRCASTASSRWTQASSYSLEVENRQVAAALIEASCAIN